MITKTTDVEELLEAEYPALAMADRCDADGVAQAFVRLVWGGSDLLLCGHHFNEHQVALIGDGWSVYEDARTSVNSRPSPSANAL